MKLRLEVSLREGFNDSDFLKRMNELGAQIDLDIKRGVLLVSKLDTSELDTVMRYLKSTFKVRRTEMIPDKVNEASSVNVMTENEVENAVQQQNVPRKVEFSHKMIEERVNKFLQVAGMAINRNNAEAKSIASFISTAICELAMMYHPHPLVDIKVGDIVNCNYGYHMPGEVSGRYVNSVVCAFDDDTVYVLPIIKDCLDDDVEKYRPFYAPYDVIYTDPFCKDYMGGSLLLQHGRRVCRQRISSIVGYVQPHFMSEILRILPGTLYFAYDGYMDATESVDSLDDDDIDISNLDIPELPSFDEIDDNHLEIEESNDLEEVEVVIPDCLKSNSFEMAVYKKFVVGLVKVNKTNSLEDNIHFFCTAIGLPTDSAQLEAAFCSSLNANSVSWVTNNTIVNGIISMTYSMCSRRLDIEKELREIFKKWIEENPDLEAVSPKTGFSFSAIFKLFFKLVKKNEE